MSLLKYTSLSILIVFTACGEDVEGTVAPPERFELVFADEFDGPAMSPPNPDNWGFDLGGDGFGNNQLEFNTNRLENARLDGEGHLEIVARRETLGTNAFTSARIQSKDRVEVRFGRIEARIKQPSGQGVWPAFWMLGADFPEESWPGVGEIDVMEFCGQEPRTIHGSLHGPAFFAGNALTNTLVRPDNQPGFDEEFHVYTVQWDPTRITWEVDGEVYQVIAANSVGPEAWVYDDPFFLILNIAVGGVFCGDPDPSTVFPQTMEVDYVRVFQRN